MSQAYTAFRMLGKLAPIALLWGSGLALAACGDRAGDPVVALQPLPSMNDAGAPLESGPGGLCAPCQNSEDCGGGRDRCLELGHSHEGSCGRHCDQQGDCPQGYECVSLGRDEPAQCIPERNECDHVVSHVSPDLATMRAVALEELNHVRAEILLPPLQPDACLDMVAQESAIELARTNDVLGKFERECEPFEPAGCPCGWRAENELNVVEYSLTWQEAIENSINDRWRNSNESFVRNISAPVHTRVGFGIVLSGDEAWTAISYGGVNQ